MQDLDLQQISDLLDNKLEKAFKDNNKVLREEIKDGNKTLRKEFKDDIKVLKGEIVDELGVIFKQTFNELEIEIKSLKNKVDLAIIKDDGIIKKHQDFEIELVANLGAHDRFENRIKVLEKKVN